MAKSKVLLGKQLWYFLPSTHHFSFLSIDLNNITKVRCTLLVISL